VPKLFSKACFGMRFSRHIRAKDSVCYLDVTLIVNIYFLVSDFDSATDIKGDLRFLSVHNFSIP